MLVVGSPVQKRLVQVRGLVTDGIGDTDPDGHPRLVRRVLDLSSAGDGRRRESISRLLDSALGRTGHKQVAKLPIVVLADDTSHSEGGNDGGKGRHRSHVGGVG